MSNKRGYLAAIVVVVCWSGFNIVSRLAGKSILTPFDLAALRFGIAGLLLSPIFVRTLRDIDRSLLLQYLTIAMFASIGYALFAYNGFSFAPAAHAGVLVNGGIPLMTALLAWLALGQQPRGRAVLGLVVALGGIVLIGAQSFAHADPAGLQWVGDVLFLCAAIVWAIAGLLMRYWRLQPIPTIAMMNGLSALLYLPVYFFWLPGHLPEAPTGTLLLQGVYQGVVAAIVAGTFYNYANHTIGPQKASLMLALVPGITAVVAVPFLGESLSVLAICGVLLVTFGAVLGAGAPANPGKG